MILQEFIKSPFYYLKSDIPCKSKDIYVRITMDDKTKLNKSKIVYDSFYGFMICIDDIPKNNIMLYREIIKIHEDSPATDRRIIITLDNFNTF